MKKIFILFSIMFLAGCATQHVFDAEKANSYLLSHKERPARIQESLAAGNLARGMNEEEVTICWGKPERIEKRSLQKNIITIWRYPENTVVGSTPRGAIIRKRLSKEVTFRDGIVIKWRELDSPS